MRRISEHELQRVSARREVEAGLGLSSAEMEVILVGRNGLVGAECAGHVDEEMMVAGVLGGAARLRDSHALEAEPDHERPLDPRSLDRGDDIGLRSGRRFRRFGSPGWSRRRGNRRGRSRGFHFLRAGLPKAQRCRHGHSCRHPMIVHARPPTSPGTRRFEQMSLKDSERPGCRVRDTGRRRRRNRGW